MSLKAKLEAVIYAAEEPVTLAQLAALFAAEALEYKAGQDAQAAAAEPQPQPQGPLPLLEEGFAYLGLEQTPAFYTATDGVPEAGLVSAESQAADESEKSPENPAGAASSLSIEAAPSTTAEAEASAPAAPSGLAVPEAGADASQSEAAATAAPVPQESDSAADSEAAQNREARQREREVRAILQALIDELTADCAADGRGVEIREIAGGYRMGTKPEYHDAVRSFVRSLKPPLKLSLQALETLAVVAYKQPVTAPEVSEIRGVESAGTLGSLLSRKLIATAGRKQVIGRPILYKTTREFLLRFGLKDISELPSMEEFEKMAAIELDEQAPAGNGDTGEGAEDLADLDVAPDGSLDPSAEPDGAKAPHAAELSANRAPAEPEKAEATHEQ